MKYTLEELKHWHESTALDDAALAKAKLMACFCCCKTFLPSEIEHFIEGENRKWAHCPYCGVDAVMHDDGSGLFDPQLLIEMEEHYFGMPS